MDAKPVTKFFVDTEFIEDGHTIELISVGVVTASGEELYLINSDCDLSRAGDWVKRNVIPHLPKQAWELVRDPWYFDLPYHKDGGRCYHLSPVSCGRAHVGLPSHPDAEVVPKPKLPWATKKDLRSHLCAFVQKHTPRGTVPEFWGLYPSYDWVVICQLFGTMTCLPSGWPHHIMDLKQLSAMTGTPIPPHEGKKHDALEDARAVRKSYQCMVKNAADRLASWMRTQSA